MRGVSTCCRRTRPRASSRRSLPTTRRARRADHRTPVFRRVGGSVPEGHTIHRLAEDYAARFSGGAVTVRSPQGTFAGAAALLDGAELHTADAHGKHLFLGFRGGEWVHIHLGLFGKVT